MRSTASGASRSNLSLKKAHSPSAAIHLAAMSCEVWAAGVSKTHTLLLLPNHGARSSTQAHEPVKISGYGHFRPCSGHQPSNVQATLPAGTAGSLTVGVPQGGQNNLARRDQKTSVNDGIQGGRVATLVATRATF